MYQLWLYKNIETANGIVSLKVKKRDYNGRAIEIDDIAVDSIILSMDGDSITDPIIGTSLSFGIIDTGQIDTEQFFTPDATLYSVQLSIDGTVAWVGYLTPDSYTESLAYRDIINLTARDNLGRLNDFTFTQAQGLQNVVTFIESLVAEVGCSQYLNWNCNKYSLKKGEGIDAITSIQGMYVNTELFIGKTYREIVEEILRGLGCQMRYIGNNNLMILSLSDLSTIEAQDAIFINSSGVKEILPAWRNLTVEQDYGLVENFFDGYINEKESGSFTFYKPSEQMPTKWDGDLYFANQYGWNTGIEDNQSESIYPALQDVDSKKSAIYRKSVKATNTMVTLSMQCNNTLRWLRDDIYRKVSNLYIGGEGRQEYTLSYSFNIYLRSQNKTYLMLKDGWVDMDSVPKPIPIPILFIMPKCVNEDQGTWNQEQEVKIEIASIPYDGELLVEIHRVFWAETDSVSDYMYYGKIRDITLAFSNSIGAVSALAQVNAKHNIDQSLQLKLGQVPSGKGDALAYAGGYYSIDGLPLSYYQRTDNEELAYNLMELVAREHIHLNNNNYSLLSGQMIGQNGNAISFGCNIRHNELYCIISASIAVISGTLDVTKMQEVTPYQVAELTIIDSPLELSSGSKVGSGNNEVIQFSNDAGNAKRLYELDQASQEDMKDSYVIIDKSSMSAAKRVPFKDVGGLFNKAFRLHYNEDGVLVSVEVLANLWTNFGITAGGEGTGSGGGTGGATSLEGLNDVSLSALVDGQSLVWSSTMNKWINKTIESGLDEDALSAYLIANNYAVKGDIPSALKSPYKLSFGDKSYDGSAEVTITAADLGALTEHQSLDGYVNTIETTGNGNAVTSVVKNGKKLTFTKGATYLTTHQDISHLLSKNDAAEIYQVKGKYLTDITSKMVTDALTYTPLANTTKYALSDSVGGNALDSAKLGGQLPSYYATATSVTKVADDLSTFKTLFDSMFEKKDGKIHAKLTLWTDYALVAGGEGDGTGGSGGGLTAFSVIVNNKTYNSNNGTATITEQLQPLITTNNKLAYSLISGTPTSLPASDVYAWAKKSSLAASDVPNLDWSKITSGKPTTLAGYGITDKVAYRETWNNFMHSGNEFTFVAPSYSGYLWMNYRTASGSSDGAITEYRFAKGAGFSYADIRAAKFIVNNGTSSQFLKADGSLDGTSYLPLSGGALTGVLTLKGEQYTGNCGIDASNSDIINLNAIYTSDLANGGNEGIQFARSNGNYDSLWAADGVLYFSPNGNNSSHTGSYSTNHTIYHTGNFNPADYLPLSGGTIYSGAQNPLNIKGSATYASISFTLDNTTYKSYLLYKGGTNWSITSENWGTEHSLIHTGNYASTTDKRYLQLGGGTLSKASSPILTLHRSDYSYDCALEFSNAVDGRLGLIGIKGSSSDSAKRPFYHDGTNYNYLIHSGNIGSQSVASAQELITSDGNKYAYHNGSNLIFGRSAIVTNIYGSDIKLRPNGTIALLLNSSGNVTIGGSDLAGTTRKLFVDGTFYSAGDIYTYGSINLRPSTNLYGTFSLNSNRMSIQALHDGVAYLPIALNPSGGNVLIGTTDDDSAKLQVKGNAFREMLSIKRGDGAYSAAIKFSNTQEELGLIAISGSGTTDFNYRIVPFWHFNGASKPFIFGDSTLNAVIEQSSGEARYIAHRTDTRKRVWFGIGSGGVNRGFYDEHTFNKWLVYTDDTLLYLNHNTRVNGNISASGAIAAGTASDIRLKDNIQTIDQNKAIEVLMSLNPITYQWNDKAKELGGFEGISQGFIAQEYESIIPNSGRAIWGEYRAIDYTKAIPYIVSVEQNHEQRIKEMVSVEQNHEQRIRQLEEELNRLRREYYGI